MNVEKDRMVNYKEKYEEVKEELDEEKDRMVNYKEKYEEVKEELDEEKDRISDWVLFIIGVIITALFGFLLLGMFGVFDGPVSELKLDEDKIAKEYLLIYYPEFENCSVEWDNDLLPHVSQGDEGVNIYCEERIQARDGLKPLKENDPTEQIVFDLGGDVDIEEAFEILMEKYK